MTQPPAPGALTRFIAASGLTNRGDGIATLAWAWVASFLTRDPLQMPFWVAAIGFLAVAALTWRLLRRRFADPLASQRR